MHPIFYTLELTAGTARLLGLLVAVLLSAYIVWDGYRQHGKARLTVTLLQAAGFSAVSLALVLVFVTPERLPEAFAVPLRTWGLMVVTGMVLCFLIQRHFGKRVGLTGDQILSIWVYGGLCALIGARLLHVLVNWSEFSAAPATALKFWDGGMVYLGAMIISLVFAIAYLRRIGKPVLKSLDALTLGIALTHGFGRLGCFSAGCCYGKTTDSALGVVFGEGSIAHYTMVMQGRILPHDVTPAVHPTQLYEAGAAFLIGLSLLLWYRSGRPKPGMILASYMLAYPTVRFFLEMVRDDPEREFLLRIPEEAPVLLSTTQTGALLIVPVAAYALWRLAKASPEPRVDSRRSGETDPGARVGSL